jgi:hypothetical protein
LGENCPPLEENLNRTVVVVNLSFLSGDHTRYGSSLWQAGLAIACQRPMIAHPTILP